MTFQNSSFIIFKVFLPKKYEHVAFAFFMSLFMSFLMSFFITLVNVGFTDDLFLRWIKAFGTAFCIAFPIVLVVAPMVKKTVHAIIKKD